MNSEQEKNEEWEEEREEEDAPENLKRKWIERDYFGKETVECPACKKFVPASSVTCLFCGAQVFHDSGLLGKLLEWFKRLFKV